ncbi:hypothetical protein JYT44_03740 [Caldithrix abyssi]|nr:hypothetical protein [Caldithrix abyssi]
MANQNYSKNLSIMDNNEIKKDELQNEIIDALLKLPVKNLLNRIHDLEKQVETRLELHLDLLCLLETQQMFFKEKSKLLHYSILPTGLSVKTNLELEVGKIEIQKGNELVGCFRDVLKLKDQIRSAREELNKEYLKSRLLE